MTVDHAISKAAQHIFRLRSGLIVDRTWKCKRVSMSAACEVSFAVRLRIGSSFEYPLVRATRPLDRDAVLAALKCTLIPRHSSSNRRWFIPLSRMSGNLRQTQSFVVRDQGEIAGCFCASSRSNGFQLISAAARCPACSDPATPRWICRPRSTGSDFQHGCRRAAKCRRPGSASGCGPTPC